MNLNHRVLSVGLASFVGLGVLAPAAMANDRSRDGATIALGAASIALLATNHRDAGLVGLGLTAVAAGLFDGGYHRFDRDDRRRYDRDDYRYSSNWGRERYGRDDHVYFSGHDNHYDRYNHSDHSSHEGRDNHEGHGGRW